MMLPNAKSHTLPSSPIHHHSSSSDFEFTVTLSPRKSTTTNLRPADELFYNGHLLPLHLSPCNSMVRTLLLTSTTTTARHSSFSYDTSDSSRPSSATHDDNHLRHKLFAFSKQEKKVLAGKNFSFNRFSSVFCKTITHDDPGNITSSSLKRMSVTAREKFRKYLKKVKPLLSKTPPPPPMAKREEDISPSFSGNLRFLSRTSCVSSCPSTMPSSPTHSGVLCRKSILRGADKSSSTEELQSAIQGAIAHCKSSMTQTAWKHK